MDERKKLVLKAVIDDYIEHVEPVGSKTLSERHDLKVSAATLRNEMNKLEEAGYLEQPHTSAGRVPTSLGYRLYVNDLMKKHRMTIREMESINEALRLKIAEYDRLLEEAGKHISRLTRCAVVTSPPKTGDERFQRQEPYLSGEAVLLEHPEFQDIAKAREALSYLSERRRSLLDTPAPEGVKIIIGPENMANELQNASVMIASFRMNASHKGLIGLVGPMRMDYSKLAENLTYFARRLSELLQSEEE